MQLSNEILVALTTIEEIENISMINFEYWQEENHWSFYLSTKHPQNTYLDQTLFWYCLIPTTYPFGSIKIYPCSKKGITSTHFHQNYNQPQSKFPWSTGKLCLASPFDLASPSISKYEPTSVEKKLLWNINRLIEWVESADKGTLIKKGEPYELPDFEVDLSQTWAFVNDKESDELFKSNISNAGFYNYFTINNGKFNIITQFMTLKREIITACSLDAGGKIQTRTGIWILSNKIPVTQDQKKVNTYHELEDFLAQSTSIRFENILKQIVKRGVHNEHIRVISIGFYIPKRKGDKEKSLHWQSFSIPYLEYKPKGFQRKVKSLMSYNYQKKFNPTKKIRWENSKNIHPKNLFSRVPEFEYLTSLNICIIGVGSLGSIFTESLVRSGVQKITIIDEDTFVEGNLCRHVLTIDNVGELKTKSLQKRLELINPYLNCRSLNQGVNLFTDYSFFNEFDYVLDFSANDKVLQGFQQNKPKLTSKKFLSFSFGIKAKQIFCYQSQLNDVSFDNFNQEISFFKEDHSNEKLPLEHIGCWSPVFPANNFAILHASATCFEFFNSNKNDNNEIFAVYKHKYTGSQYDGLERIK